MDPSRRPVSSRCALAAVLVASLVIGLGPSRSFLEAQSTSGGFLEEAPGTAARAAWTPEQVRSFLPLRGEFAFPAPYGTEGVRITNASDCGGGDCVTPLGSSWRSINNHRGRAVMLIVLGLRGAGPTLFRYDKARGTVETLGPLFDAPVARQAGGSWYFSATRPTTLYVSDGSALLRRYDVMARTFETVFDATAEFGETASVSEPRSSDDDRVHSALLSDSASHAALGCLAYREDTRQLSYYPATGGHPECQVDASGRFLSIRDGADGADERIVDLRSGAERVLFGDDAARADAGRGRGYAVSDPYACGDRAASPDGARPREIVCFRLDAPSDVLVVAQAMGGPRAAHRRSPAVVGNLDVTGRYFLWLGESGDSRRDAFMVRVPADRLRCAGDAGCVPGPALAHEEEPEPPTAAAERAPLAPASPIPAPATDPTLLPVATTAQVPLTTAYNAINVPSLAAGATYQDPTTNVRIYKLTSATFPAASANWGHDYAEGGDEVSLPYNGSTRAVVARQNGGAWWLVDFTPGVGVSNPRQLTGVLSPFMDLAFAFSNNPATPWYAYVSNGTTIRRFDIRTMTEATGGGWPVTDASAMWLHQSENDALFVWMRGSSGTTVVGYEPSTGTLKTYTNAGLNEPRVDRAGRYVGISMTSPPNGLVVWDWQGNAVAWSTPGDPGPPFAHNASLRRRWMSVDWNISYPYAYSLFKSDVANSAVDLSGPTNGGQVHGNGNWIQHPADLGDQWAAFSYYGGLRPSETFWLAPGGCVLATANGQRRLLLHPYNTSANYTFFTFGKFSPDGSYLLFTSDMDGSGRSDLFLAEVPTATGDATAPTVSLTAPAAGATVSGTAVSVSATAADNVAVVGVQFELDGANLGVEDTSSPYSVTWNTTTAANGSHSLTAVARDAAGNVTVSAAVAVTVSNVDTTPPVISAVAASGVSSADATVTWTTNEAADAQVDYGTTTAYGASTTLDATLALSHSQALKGLAANTTYHYRVRSKDAAGNLSLSADASFTTLASVDAGLLGYWKLDEGSGLTTADASGSGNTGSLVNGPVWTAGRIGQAVSLDGVDDYVNVPHVATLDPFPLSVAGWVQTSTTTGIKGFLNKYVPGSYNGYQIFFNNGDLCAWYLRDTADYVYDGGGCTMKASGYNNGQWHHVALVVDATGGRLYVDGLQKASQPWTGTSGAVTTTQALRFGDYPGIGATEYLPGAVDEVRLYSRALTPTEITLLATAAPDTTPPVISGMATSGITGTAATLTWTTNELADSQVDYGTTTAYGSSTALSATLVLAHSQAVSGLAASTVYHYRVRSKDAAGNLAVSGDATFKTLDTVPPTAAITVPAAGASETGTVTVSATAADDVGVVGVQFKLDGAVLGAEVLAAPYSVPWNTSASANGSHALTAVARDAAGNSTTSAAVAVTVSNADLTPPVISTVSATGITSSAATITWTTNEAADSQVDYGTTATYGSSTTLAAALATAHSQALAGLAAGTLHHYRVRSNDAAGNLALSPDATFTTLAVVPTIDVGVLAHWKLDEGSGTSALDSSGNGNTASLMNGAAWGSGRAGSGLLLDGVNDYASVPHAAALDAFPLSVSVWFKTSTHSGLRGVVNKYAAASANGYQIFFNSGRLCAWYFKDASDYVYDGGGCGLKAGAYNDDRWHQALLVVDAAGGKLYVDAALKASRSWTGTAGATATTQDVHLGDYPGVAAASAYLPGAIDEVRIYNRALSAAEAVQLYGELPPLVDVTPPLLTSVTVASQLPGSATITWNTDEAADSQVEYGTTTAYGTASPLASALVKPHTVTLSGLAPTTLYHYRAKSRDAAGNVGYSADFTFTSLAASTAGPIAYWALDETAGTIAADSSGNGNTGTLVNGPVWTAGHTAGGLSLDGIDDYVSVPHAAALNSFPLTVAVWFNTTTSSGVRGLVNKYVANAYNGYEIFFNDGNLCAWYLRDTADYVYDASGCALSTPGYNDGQWHQAVFVVDVSGGSLYVDGALKAAMPWTGVAGPVTTTQDIHLGHYPGAAGGAEYLPALIDEVRIYDIGMTPLRVLALFQHGN